MSNLTPEEIENKKILEARLKKFSREVSVGINISHLDSYHDLLARYDAIREFYNRPNSKIPNFDARFSNIYKNRDALRNFYLNNPDYYMWGPDKTKAALDFVMKTLTPDIFFTISEFTNCELKVFEGSFTQLMLMDMLDDFIAKFYDDWGYTEINGTRDRHIMFLKLNHKYNDPQI